MAAFIAARRTEDQIPCAVSCRALQVSRSWHYKWSGRGLPPRAARRERLKAEVRRLFERHEGKRGSHKPWTAGHDVIDCALLERALAGVPARDAARVRDACARWRRLRFAVDATAYPRPDAGCSPGRGHVHNGACHCKDSSKTVP